MNSQKNYFRDMSFQSTIKTPTELETLDRAAEILEQRYQKKEITLAEYQAQALAIKKRREALKKRNQ